jgi:hypothetical protein
VMVIVAPHWSVTPGVGTYLPGMKVMTPPEYVKKVAAKFSQYVVRLSQF